jgi:hypothetical protein
MIDVLYQSTPLPAMLRDALKGAGWVRNRFAHLPLAFVLSDEMWEKFKTYLDPQFLSLIEDSVKDGRGGAPGNPTVNADSTPSRIRLGFLIVHKGLTTMLGAALGHPKPEELTG